MGYGMTMPSARKRSCVSWMKASCSRKCAGQSVASSQTFRIDARLAERDEGHDRHEVARGELGGALELGRDLLDDTRDAAKVRVVVDADLGLEPDDG